MRTSAWSVRWTPARPPSSAVAAALVALALCLLAGAPVLADSEGPLEATFESDGVTLHYYTIGQGDPLVLLHGFTATAEANWFLPGIAAELAEHHRVVAIDHRGHGKSGKPHDPAQYGAQMVRDVVNLLDHLEIEKADVAGYSMGAFITLKLLTVAPERVDSAVLGGAGWSGEQGLPGLEELAASLESGQGLTPLLRTLTPADAPPMTDEQIQFMNQMVLASNDPKALAAVARGMAGLVATRDQVAAIDVPVLAVIGSRDPLKAGVDALQQVLPAVQVVVLDGADHMTATMDPNHAAKFSQAMLEFFAAVPAAP